MASHRCAVRVVQLSTDGRRSLRLMPPLCCALACHTVLVAWRNRWATAIRLLAPLLFLALALVVQEVMGVNERRSGRIRNEPVSVPTGIGAIPACSSELFIHDKPCLDFVYSPNSSAVVQVG